MTQTSKDVDLLRMTTNDQEQRLSSLSSDLKSVKQEYDTLQAKYSGLNNDVSVMTIMIVSESKCTCWPSVPFPTV